MDPFRVDKPMVAVNRIVLAYVQSGDGAAWARLSGRRRRRREIAYTVYARQPGMGRLGYLVIRAFSAGSCAVWLELQPFPDRAEALHYAQARGHDPEDAATRLDPLDYEGWLWSMMDVLAQRRRREFSALVAELRLELLRPAPGQAPEEV